MSETPEELRARSLAKMSEVYGWEFQDGPGDFYGITADHLFGEIWSREGLTVAQRRLLLIGAAAFGAASILAAFAPSSSWLIAARGLLGLGGSTLMPSTLAIIRNVFVGEADRAKAIGIWSAVMAGGVFAGAQMPCHDSLYRSL